MSRKSKNAAQVRKLWTEESMKAAVKSCQEGKGLRETSRLYNVPVETLRRRVTGAVEMGCRSGPPTVFTEEQEDQLSEYLVKMSEMGFGLTRDDILHLAFNMAELTGQSHPFREGKAGRGWFEGFMSRHQNLTLRKPQPLSYCRALCANKETIDDFFGKLGGLYGRLNLISKPMNIYNADETGVSVVYKPGRVVAELGHSGVYSLCSAERGKTHTVLSCVSASGFVLPPLMVYPRKKSVPDHLRLGAIPNTLFSNSQSGWITKEIYLEWFKWFVQSIPPARPMLLIQDGHASHISIELIELARDNGVHLLCLPAHTTHILQPLDVGVFKSFKSHFSKACSGYLSKHPGRVITTDVIASLVAEAWPNSFTLVNILSGFRKCGIFPINPGAVSDRQLAPSKALRAGRESEEPTSPFTPEQDALYERRFQEGYDIPDPSYAAWLKINHPLSVTSEPPSESSCRSAISAPSSTSGSLTGLLQLPKPLPAAKSSREKSLNYRAVCITDDASLGKLKAREERKVELEREKEAKKLERARKREEKQKEKQARKLTKERRKGKEEVEAEETVCPKCGKVYGEDSTLQWICCDTCDTWYDIKCTSVKHESCIPDNFYCDKCV